MQRKPIPQNVVSGSRPHWRKAFTFYLQGVGGSTSRALRSTELVLELSLDRQERACLIDKRIGSAAEPLKPACSSLPGTYPQAEVTRRAPEWCESGCWVYRHELLPLTAYAYRRSSSARL
jgi:hypothetical protein